MKNERIVIRHGKHDPESDSGKYFAAKAVEATSLTGGPNPDEASGLTERGKEMAEETRRAIIEMPDTDDLVE